MVLESSRRPKEATGARYIAARKGCVIKVAKDNVGLISDTSKDTFTVLLGQPVIDSISPRITWINDDSTYTVFAHDIHGTIKKYLWDLDWNGSWDDSANTDALAAHFASAGTKQVRVGVRDDDTLLTVDTFPVTVRLGRPWVRAASDTLYIPSTDGTVGIKLSSKDTNGTIAYYKWDRAVDGSIQATTATDSLYYDLATLNLYYQWAVYIKDDDSITNADTFWVYPDAPPPAPDTVAPRYDTLMSSATISLTWRNTDVHDGDQTQYRIVMDGNTTPVAVMSDFKAGTLYTSLGGGSFKSTVTPTGSGIKFWRVDAKDARGSITLGRVSRFAYYP